MKGRTQLLFNQTIRQEAEANMGIPVSKFQFVERGTQSRNSVMREVEVQTQGPPKLVFSGTVDRSEMVRISRSRTFYLSEESFTRSMFTTRKRQSPEKRRVRTL